MNQHMSVVLHYLVLVSFLCLSQNAKGNDYVIRCRGSEVQLNRVQYWGYQAVRRCFNGATLPPAAGGGFIGNLATTYGSIIGVTERTICTSVHDHVMPQVQTCTHNYYQRQNIGLNQRTVFPCSIFQRGLVSDHAYMGICRGTPGRPNTYTLIVWTDPWNSENDFYCPNTGRNRPDHQLN